MDKITIAIVKPSNIESTTINNEINKNNIMQIILENIEIKEIMFNDMFETILKTIKYTPELAGSTDIFNETATNVYQICYLPDSKENKNNIGTLLIDNENQVNGNCVLISSRITENYTCNADSISIKDIYNILYSKLIHKGIKIDTADNVTEFAYDTNPLKDIYDESKPTWQYIEIPLFKFNLILFCQLKAINNNNNINKKATRLVGDKIIYGDVIVVSKSTEHTFIDLGLDTFNKILNLTSSKLISRELKEDETKDGEKINGLPMNINRYLLLEKRYKEYKMTCNYCNKLMDKIITCAGCYRVMYDHKECLKQDWDLHKNECLYKKLPFNV